MLVYRLVRNLGARSVAVVVQSAGGVHADPSAESAVVAGRRGVNVPGVVESDDQSVVVVVAVVRDHVNVDVVAGANVA